MHPSFQNDCITLMKEENLNFTRELFIAYKYGNCKKLEQLFSLIYNEYADLIFIVISKYVKQYEDIEELTDDVFIRLFNHLENIDPDKDIKYYLMTSAKNASVNFLKKRRSFEMSDPSMVGNGISDDSHLFLFLEEWSKVLDRSEIDLIIAHDLEGVSLKELALKNNRSPNTIKSIYRRAIKKLHHFYKEKEYEKVQ